MRGFPHVHQVITAVRDASALLRNDPAGEEIAGKKDCESSAASRFKRQAGELAKRYKLFAFVFDFDRNLALFRLAA
jgi:hypothetical protein